MSQILINALFEIVLKLVGWYIGFQLSDLQ